MASKPSHIELGSRIYKEDYTTSWRIGGFNLMPFQEDHPVHGPWFMLGKNRQSTWSVLVTKEVHDAVKDLGFKLVRADDEAAMWDMATFSLGVKLEDGRFVQCIDKKVVGKESNNSFVYLVKTGKDEEFKRSGLRSCEVQNPADIPANGACGGTPEKSIFDMSYDELHHRALAKFMEEANLPLGTCESTTCCKKPTKAPTLVGENESIPENLFQQETITVVCEIEYTYMMADPMPEKEAEADDESEQIASFKSLFNNERFSDVTLKCGSVDVPCHKVVLYTRSRLFQQFMDRIDPASSGTASSGTASSDKAQQRLVINVNHDAVMLKAVLLYMYNNELADEVAKSEDNLWKLYKSAGIFGIPGLRSLCLEVLEENDECREENSKDSCDHTSVLSVYGYSDGQLPVITISTQTSVAN